MKKTRILAAFLALALVVGLLPSMSAKAAGTWNSGGDGSEATPYIISTYDQLNNFAEAVNTGTEPLDSTYDTYVKLADGFPTSTDTKTVLETPIGNDTYYFAGTFDGNGQTVKLNINLTNSEYVGMFGYVDDSGTVKNVKTTGTVTASFNSPSVSVCCGSVVGYNKGIVENCSSAATVTCTAPSLSSTAYAGGVVGCISSGTVSNCYATGAVTASSNSSSAAGGVAGYNGSNVANCYATGNVTAEGNASSKYAGGIVGYMLNTSVTNCYATGTITGTTKGGVIGFLFFGTVTICYYKAGIADNGVGEGTDNTIALSDAQMKAAAGETNESEWASTSYGKCALVDALNTKAEAAGYNSWKVSGTENGGYPCLAVGLCEVGATKYASIEAALKGAAGNAETVPATENATAPTVIKLIGDVKEYFDIPSTRNITLDLNGHVLDLDGHHIKNAGTLTVKDSAKTGDRYFTVQEDGLWTLDTGKTSGTALSELTAYPAAGSVIKVTGGVITGGNAGESDSSGGAIFSTGSLTVQDVNLIGNQALTTGGSIFSARDCTVTGSTICGNAADQGSAVYEAYYSSAEGTLKLEDVLVFGNTATDVSAVYVDGKQAVLKNTQIRYNCVKPEDGDKYAVSGMHGYDRVKITLAGDTVIADNMTVVDGNSYRRNLRLYNSYVQFSNDPGMEPKPGMKIGVLYGVDSPTAISTQCNTDYSEYFFSDDIQYYIKYNDEKKLVFENRVTQQPNEENGFTLKFYADDLTEKTAAYQWGLFHDNAVSWSTLAADKSNFKGYGTATPLESGTGEDILFDPGEGYISFQYTGSALSDGDFVTFSTDAPIDANDGCYIEDLGEGQYRAELLDLGEGYLFIVCPDTDKATGTYNDLTGLGTQNVSFTIRNFVIHHLTQEDIPSQTTERLTVGQNGTLYRCAITVGGETFYTNRVEYTSSAIPVPAVTRLDSDELEGEFTLQLNGISVNGITCEKNADGKTFILRNADGKALMLNPVNHQLVPVAADKDATVWYYNGGLFAMVNVNRTCRCGFFRAPRYVRYYLAASAYGTAYARLLFAPALAEYETELDGDLVTLDYTPSASFVGLLKKPAFDFTITAPEDAMVSYKAGLSEGFGTHFTMAYRPALVYITVTVGKGADAVTTSWQAKLTATGYVMSVIG